MKVDKLVKEALSFSKMEGVRSLSFDKYYYGSKEVYMKVSRTILIISLIVLVALGGILLFYDEIFVSPKQTNTIISEKAESKEQVEEIEVKQPSQIDAVVTMVLGDVKVQNILNIYDLEVGYTLKEGDTIITSSDSECEIQINKKILVRVSENTKVSFHQIALSVDKGKNNIVEIISGSLKSAVKDLGKDSFKVKTSTAVAAVRGTKFSVSVDEKNNTKVVVSEGKVEVKVRSKVMQDLIQQLPQETQDVDDSFGGVVLVEGNSIVISDKEQAKLDSKLSEVMKQKESIDEKTIMEVRKVGEKVASNIKLNKKPSSLFDLDAINSKVSKNLISTGEFVKVRFELAKGVKDVKLFINDVEIDKFPVVRIFEKNKEYYVKAQSGKKVLIDDKMKFNEDTKVVIKETIELKQETKAEESIVKGEKVLNFGAKVVSGYGRWPVYTQKYIFYTSSGVSIFDGDRIKNLNLRGNSYSVYGNNVVLLTKDQNDYLVVKVADINGRILGEFNLGEPTKGTLVIGRAVLIDKNVFVPTIDGLYIVDIKTGDRKVINIGSIYSDVALIGSESVVCVNEIGEVYIVNSSGSYSKLSQLSTTTVRRGIVASDSGRVYILIGSSMYILDRSGNVKSVNLGIRAESEPIVYRDKVIVAGDKKVLVLNRDGIILNSIILSGNLVVPPYVGNGYIVVSATDGVHVYDIDTGNEKNRYDIIGSISFIYGKNLYIIGENDTKVIELK